MMKYKLLNEIDINNININNECCICLSNIDNNKVILNCNHFFHKNCILSWMDTRQNCPICRKDTKYILNLKPEKNEEIIIEITQQQTSAEEDENSEENIENSEENIENSEEAIINIKKFRLIKLLCTGITLGSFYLIIYLEFIL